MATRNPTKDTEKSPDDDKNPEVLPEGQDKEALTVPEGDHKQVVSEGDKHEGAGHEKQGVSEGDNKQGAGVGESGAVPSSQANNC